jgi:hypothetical protein
MKRLFSESPEHFIRRIQHEHADGSGAIETFQDITQTVEENKFNFNERSGKRWDHFQNHVASIPTSIYYKLVREGIIDDRNDPEMVALKRWLNDPDNRVFRTRDGRL